MLYGSSIAQRLWIFDSAEGNRNLFMGDNRCLLHFESSGGGVDESKADVY
jgi:hypothetical protein